MASTDTFKCPSIVPHSAVASSFASRGPNGAFHGHFRDALLAPFSIEDLDILDGPDAVRFFEQEALLVDACHIDEQDMAQDLNPTWSLDEFCSQDGVQHTSTPAVMATCVQYSPSSLHTECDTLHRKEALQKSKLSSVPFGRDKVTKTHSFSRLALSKTASKHVDSCAMDGDNDGKRTHAEKAPTSKNIVSERKRRRKLNEKLYSLRALVPKISKMDKASIVNDAIDYVQDLQKLVKDMEDEIHTLRTRASCDTEEAFQYLKGGLVSVTSTLKEVDYKILKVDVVKMEATTYHLRILCIRGRGVFVKLAKALEALQLEIVNANLTSVNDHILNTIILKAKNGRTMEPRELREMILEVVPRYGLGLAKRDKDLGEER